MHDDRKRIVFLDWLRVVACLMVMVVHACEAFYFDADGNTCFRTLSDARWAAWTDAPCRAAVPLFVMASSFLLFPLTRSTGDFFRRRLVRVFIPFAVWLGVYAVSWGLDWGQLVFNFPFAAGHLWFVPMLLGLYLLMPLLSPWAEKVSKAELKGWIAVWLFTTLFPFIRKLWGVLYGDASVSWGHTFGVATAQTPFLWGECPWNSFGMFHYVSGFFGFLLLGFYFRRFLPQLSWRRTLVWAIPLWVVGYAIVGGLFYFRIPFDGTFPLVRPYELAVDLETSWEFCGIGLVMTVIAYFLVFRKLNMAGVFYDRLIRPISEASYGMYLMHMLILTPVVDFYRTFLPTPMTIFATAFTTFALVALFSVLLRRIPRLGSYIVG